jgi:hypothetical protein
MKRQSKTAKIAKPDGKFRKENASVSKLHQYPKHFAPQVESTRML